jgi:hypothetical protein
LSHDAKESRYTIGNWNRYGRKGSDADKREIGQGNPIGGGEIGRNLDRTGVARERLELKGDIIRRRWHVAQDRWRPWLVNNIAHAEKPRIVIPPFNLANVGGGFSNAQK